MHSCLSVAPNQSSSGHARKHDASYKYLVWQSEQFSGSCLSQLKQLFYPSPSQVLQVESQFLHSLENSSPHSRRIGH